jgi:plastocyanin
MRRLPLAAIALLALAATACTSGGEAGWTYAPAPSATAVPSADASASAQPPTGSVAPSGTPAASDGGPSGQPSTTVVEVAAPVGSAVTGFEPTELTGPADTPFTIEFDNQDNTAPHNFVLNDPGGQPVNIGDTAIFTGPEVRTYEAPALAEGAYPFVCQVHPTTMTGTLTLE